MKKLNLSLDAASWFERLPLLVDGVSILAAIYFVILIVTTPFYLIQIGKFENDGRNSSTDAAVSIQDINTYTNILTTHPLFGNMQQNAAPVAAPCTDFKTRYAVSGIVGGGAQNEAIINDRTGSETHVVKSGETLGSAVIESIKPQSIVINCSGTQIEVGIEGS